jgi:hypothetical protein
VFCLVLTRLLVMLFAAELSGVTHAALDVCGSLEGAAHGQSDCEDHEGGHECPPGCPSCHCWHAGTPSAPIAMRCELQRMSPPSATQGFAPRASVTPARVDPDSVYRPPRLDPRLS